VRVRLSGLINGRNQFHSWGFPQASHSGPSLCQTHIFKALSYFHGAFIIFHSAFIFFQALLFSFKALLFSFKALLFKFSKCESATIYFPIVSQRYLLSSSKNIIQLLL
jgi:hypothetical protein